MKTTDLHIETLAVLGGKSPDPTTRALGVGVWKTTVSESSRAEP